MIETLPATCLFLFDRRLVDWRHRALLLVAFASGERRSELAGLRFENLVHKAQPLSVPWPIRLAQRWPVLQRIPARVVGVGFQPEHVQTRATAGT